MDKLMEKLTQQYPDITLITEIYKDLKNESDRDELDGKADSKYRPLPLLLAVLYKLQERKESMYRTEGQLISETSSELLELAGFYWHLQHTTGKLLREGVNKGDKDVKQVVETNRLKMSQVLGVEQSDIAHVWLSEMSHNKIVSESREVQLAKVGSSVVTPERLDDHCPDFVVILDHHHRAVVLIIFGTRIFPKPSAHDLIMNLTSDTEKFLDGQAHAGMVKGTRNLIKNALPKVAETLKSLPGYSLLIVGYSLGAGLAQLLTLHIEHENGKTLLPPGTQVRTITYGVPPVYWSAVPSPLPNLLMFINHGDGVCGASLKCINDMFLKTRTIHRLNLQRRTLIAMVLSTSSTQEESYTDEIERIDILDEEAGDEERNKDSNKEDNGGGLMSKAMGRISSLRTIRPTVTSDIWDKVESAVDNLKLTDHPPLCHVGLNLFLVRKTKKETEVTKFRGHKEISQFSDKFRLDPGMFKNHMPWGYNGLFNGLGSQESSQSISLDVLDLEQQKQDEQGSLYPDLASFH